MYITVYGEEIKPSPSTIKHAEVIIVYVGASG